MVRITQTQDWKRVSGGMCDTATESPLQRERKQTQNRDMGEKGEVMHCPGGQGSKGRCQHSFLQGAEGILHVLVQLGVVSLDLGLSFLHRVLQQNRGRECH